MPTLEELMAEVLPASQGQTKVASTKSASTEEIDKVLEGLGLSDGDAVKTASEQINDNGGNMNSLTDLLYGELLGEAKEETVEKVASEETKEVAEQASEGLEAFGEATGHYFNAALETYMDKVAGDANPDPMHASSLGKSMGAHGESPRMETNHADATKGQAPDVLTKNHGEYDDVLQAAKQVAILKRFGKDQGRVGSYK